MEPDFAGKSVPGLDQMPDTPTRRGRHRRAHSETFFHFPDLDDILIDNVVVSDLNLDLPQIPNFPPAPHSRSLSVDADFFDLPMAAESNRSWARHRHSNSMDGYSCATLLEVECKKAMPTDRLAELALIDPKRAKRIVANRQSAARSKERKTRYTNELEGKVRTLQSEATTLSAQITLLQRDTNSLTAENKELKLKLQAMEQQAHLRDALNDAVRDELNWLKNSAGHQVNRGRHVQPATSLRFLGEQQPDPT